MMNFELLDLAVMQITISGSGLAPIETAKQKIESFSKDL